MVKYRNPNKELENTQTEELEREMSLMNEPATSADEEVWKKRYGDQQRYLSQVKNENKNRIEELERKLDQALRGQIQAPKSEEDVAGWMKEYPEFGAILKTIIQKELEQATASTNEKLAKVELKQKELDAQEAFMLLKEIHPDLNKLLSKDSDFRKWLDKQPQRYKDKMNSLDVDEASLVINAFKSDKKVKSNSKVDDDFTVSDAAKVVRTSATVEEPTEDFGDYEFSESQIARESARNRKWYEINEDKIMSAARRGKILYDVSGAAR